MPQSRKKRFADDTYYRGAFRWMGIGIEFCLVVGVFCLIGYFLDKLEPATSPGWLVMGFFVGFGVMLYNIIRRARKTSDAMDADTKENSLDDDTP